MGNQKENALVIEVIPEAFSVCKVVDYTGIDIDQPFVFTGRTDEELVFEESRRIAAEQGFLNRLLAEKDESGRPIWNEKETAALRILRQELRKTSALPEKPAG